MRAFTDITDASRNETRVLANRVNNLQFTRIDRDPTPADPNSGDETTVIAVNVQVQKDVLQGRTMQSSLTSQATLRNE